MPTTMSKANVTITCSKPSKCTSFKAKLWVATTSNPQTSIATRKKEGLHWFVQQFGGFVGLKLPLMTTMSSTDSTIMLVPKLAAIPASFPKITVTGEAGISGNTWL